MVSDPHKRRLGVQPTAQMGRNNHVFAECCASQQILGLDVRFGSKADIPRCGRDWRYSMTSSARESIIGGTVMPSAFAVL